MKINSIFKFSKIEQKGVFALGLIIFSFQMFYLLVDLRTTDSFSDSSNLWMNYQDTINKLKANISKSNKIIYPFNPNFISDFKGYQLGMSIEEINRLNEYRKQNKFVNSAEEFQSVTKISDKLLLKISPFFKFPDWVKHKNEFKKRNYIPNDSKSKVYDINTATKDQLMDVYGVGEVLSSRIISQRKVLGAFVNMNQMNEIWGLSPEVIDNLKKAFKVQNSFAVNKINVNKASLKELSAFPYFKFKLAKSIVTYRSMNGDIKSAKDLTKINGFPVDNVDIIALYLDF